MIVPFTHKNNLKRMVWERVPEPLPQTYRIPFPCEEIEKVMR